LRTGLLGPSQILKPCYIFSRHYRSALTGQRLLKDAWADRCAMRRSTLSARFLHLAAFDVHSRVAMRILRHSKIAVAMEIYAEAPSDATRDALRKFSDWLA
jgi:hypothetical protein